MYGFRSHLRVTLKRNGGFTYGEIDFKTARPRGVVSPSHGERREGGGSWPRAREGGGSSDGENRPDDALRAKISPGARFGRKIWLYPVKRWRH